MKVKYNLYKNKRCFIVGTGKSLDNIDVSLLKDEITIGIKKYPIITVIIFS